MTLKVKSFLAGLISILSCVFLLSSSVYADYDDPTYLSDMDTFEESGSIHVYKDSIQSGDAFGNKYVSHTTVRDDDSYLEYYLPEDTFSELCGTLYIPDKAVEATTGNGLSWENAEFIVYGDDNVIYEYSDFEERMKPLEVKIDISGIEFLKLRFANCSYSNIDGHNPLVKFGNALLHKSNDKSGDEKASSGETLFCPKCGYDLKNVMDAVFCPHCGNKL